jgi:hypothetical protein
MYAIKIGLLGCDANLSEEPAASILGLDERLSHSNGGPIIGFKLRSIYIIIQLC